MPRLIIAEKPSVARDLARVLGAKQKQKGFIQGNGWLITWCIGHLVELCEPHEYQSTWKKWSLTTLPMLPENFLLRPQKNTRSQFEVVRRLMSRKDVQSVVNACDAGREGELIFRYAYELAGCNKRTERLWISSMTDEAIQQGFSRLQPGEHYDDLWHAARCRSEADWLVGLNATRAMTIRTRQFVRTQNAPLLSVGRVQTPTLAMLVHREQEIIHFVPQDYWQLLGHFSAEPGDYTGKWFLQKSKDEKVDRFFKEEEAQALMEKLQDKSGEVQKVDRRKVREKPPYLFDLTRLQRTANKRFGFSAARTLEIAQGLYQNHKVITYPRTDSIFLPSDMIPKMKSTFRALHTGPYEPFTDFLLGLEKLPISRRFFNDKKVTDHHAIIPTTKRANWGKLNMDEQKIYDIIIRRFLGAFFPDAVFEKTTVITVVEEETFLTRGKVLLERGWREVAGLPDNPRSTKKNKAKKGGESDDDEESAELLPPLKEGDVVSIRELELLAKKTKPPPRYTEATLLSAMEGAGKKLEDEELQQAMKDSGLGTPATRASIIETLLFRKYIERNKKTLHPTTKGILLVEAMPVESLKSPQLTGQWEARLARIARGEDSHQDFEVKVRDYVTDLVNAIRQTSPNTMQGFMQHAHDASLQGTTKSYGKKQGGYKKKGKSTTKKSGGYSKKSYSKKTTKKSTSTRKKTTSKSSYVQVSSPPPEQPIRISVRQGLATCPSCGIGQMIQGKRAWGCNRWRDGCQTVIPFTLEGRDLSTQETRKLLEEGQLGPLKGFQDGSGSSFMATLFLKVKRAGAELHLEKFKS